MFAYIQDTLIGYVTKPENVPAGCDFVEVSEMEVDSFPKEFESAYIDPETEKLVFIESPPPSPLPEPLPPLPTELERLTARVDYLSLMTGVDV